MANDVVEPTIITIKGPPGGYKSILLSGILLTLKKHVPEAHIYVREESQDVIMSRGTEENCRFRIYLEQT